MKGYKNIINFLAKNNADYFNIFDEVPGRTTGQSESPVGMAKDLSHLHSCDTDIYKLETYFVAK